MEQQPAHHLFLAGPVAPALVESKGIRRRAGFGPSGDATTVFAPLRPVGGDGGGATQTQDRHGAFPHEQRPVVSGPGHVSRGFHRYELGRFMADKVDHRQRTVGDHHLQKGAGGPRHPQKPGNGLATGPGHRQHGLRRGVVDLLHQVPEITHKSIRIKSFTLWAAMA